jgi:hypothetical protein
MDIIHQWREENGIQIREIYYENDDETEEN